eukprot:758371-Alexandrium_andersonii.AAC.1
MKDAPKPTPTGASRRGRQATARASLRHRHVVPARVLSASAERNRRPNPCLLYTSPSPRD